MPPLLSNIGEFWRRAGLVQRVAMLGILLACVGAGVLLVGWARKPEMALLYSKLEPDEAAKIVEKIRDDGTVYQLKDNGCSIYVPQDKVYSLRLSMASEGLPTGGQIGYKLLDENRIGTSPFLQRVNYVRALEGELAKTISLIDGVEACRVHIVRPESTLFAGQQKKATATIALKLRAGWRLSRSNVAAVVHLVAGAVESLKPSDVVVVDDKGTLYTGDEDNALTRGASSILDYKSQVEQYLSDKAERMLTTVLGPNRATVRVSVTLETMSTTKTVEKYDPEGKVVRRETLKTKSTPAAVSNGKTPMAPGKESTTETDYELSKTIEQSTDLPGQIKTKTVAAFVDLTPPKQKDGKDAAATAKLTVKDVEEIIRSALGLSDTDKLKVVDTHFRQAPAAAVADTGGEGGGMQFWLEMARRSSLGILVIGVLLALKIFGGSKKKKTAAIEGQVATPENMLPGGGTGGEVNTELLRSQITSALQENPEEVKRLFLSWVQSEEGE